MNEFRINSRPLVLSPGTVVEMEHYNALFTSGVQDDFSLPFVAPVAPNAVTLAHAQLPALHNRRITFENAQHLHHGIPMHHGTVKLLGNDKGQFNAHFVDKGFSDAIRNVRLPDALLNHVFNLEEDLEVYGWYYQRGTFAEGNAFTFPMHYNPTLYGGANPQWVPEVSPWNSSDSYSTNALVSSDAFTNNVKRSEIWQCISPVSGGLEPPNNPTNWELKRFGVVNRWDASANDFYQNSPGLNYYAMCPWFYAKWAIREALASIGYTAKGTYMEDVATHEVLLANATTIDKVSTQNALFFFRATQDTDHDWNSWIAGGGIGNRFTIAANDDSTGANQDLQSCWDNADPFVFRPQTDGQWRFRARIRVKNRAQPGDYTKKELRAYIFNGSDQPHNLTIPPFFDLSDPGTIPYHGRTVVPLGGSDLWVTIEFTCSFGPGDVGQAFVIHFKELDHGSNWGIPHSEWHESWPNNYVNGTIGADSWISGWLADVTDYCEADTLVHAHRHVPDRLLGDFLTVMADTFNFSIEADSLLKTVTLNYRDDQRVHGGASDQTPRLLGPLAMDHQRRTPGYRVRWDMPMTDVPLNGVNGDLNTVDKEADLQLPLDRGLHTLVYNSKKLLESKFDLDTGLLYWEHVGYHIPDATIGDADHAEEITPDCRPLHMEELSVDTLVYLMPVMDHAGTSAYFGNQTAFDEILLCNFLLIADSANLEKFIPGASSWGVTWIDPAPFSLFLLDQVDDNTGLFPRLFQAWLQFLVNSETFTAPLLLDHAFMHSGAWKRPFMLQGQQFLLERMSVRYSDHPALIAKEAQLRRFVPIIPGSTF